MSVFGKRRELALHDLPEPRVIQYMWDQGIYLLVVNGVFYWMERKEKKA